MSPSNRNRDDPFDRLIREALRTSEPARASGECLDAATVAAMADGTLTAADRVAAEAHASGCDRCQAFLAAMARSQVDLASARVSWWRAPTVRWVGPIAAATAAAAALVIWLVVPDRSTSTEPTRAAASQAREVLPPAVSPPAVSPPAVSRQVAPPPAVSTPAERRRQSPPQSAQGLASRTNQAPPETEADKARASAAPASAAPAATAAPSSAARASDARGVVGGIAGLRDEAVLQKPPAPAAKATRETDRLSRSDALRLVVVAPDPAVRWRVLNGGAVQRSTDGGSTWQSQATGVTASPTAGASPAPLVCWLVGPGGVVLLSTDGATWTRVPFPEAVDLVSVRASDNKTAIVATSDGRAFRTEDGGQSWVRTPLQDF